jgi:acyl transferase domain-containing protein
MSDDWNGMLTRDWETLPRYTATGLERGILANRVSYFFDWHGPSITVDTACSSSMVALDNAVQTLRSGRSKVAVAAGTNLILSPGESNDLVFICQTTETVLTLTYNSHVHL